MRTIVTNNFGYYRFDDIAVGETYVFSVSDREGNLSPRIINVMGEIENLDFAAQP